MKAQYDDGALAYLEQVPAQARCDRFRAQFRAEEPRRRPLRRDPPLKPQTLVETDDGLRQRLAEELEYARRRLEAMGNELSCDGVVIMRHMVSMQALDVVSQMLGHIANVIPSSDPDRAVQRIGMCDLKARLTRTSID